MEAARHLKRQIQILVWIVIVGIVLSGVTAYPLEWELGQLASLCDSKDSNGELCSWIHRVHTGIKETNKHYPFISYGTDWLAFAHLVIALAFIRVLTDPIRNLWVVEWALITSLLVVPHALIAGHIREIPLFHQVIDCMFGVIAAPLLFLIRSRIKRYADSLK